MNGADVCSNDSTFTRKHGLSSQFLNAFEYTVL